MLTIIDDVSLITFETTVAHTIQALFDDHTLPLAIGAGFLPLRYFLFRLLFRHFVFQRFNFQVFLTILPDPASCAENRSDKTRPAPLGVPPAPRGVFIS